MTTSTHTTTTHQRTPRQRIEGRIKANADTIADLTRQVRQLRVSIEHREALITERRERNDALRNQWATA